LASSISLVTVAALTVYSEGRQVVSETGNRIAKRTSLENKEMAGVSRTPAILVRA